MALLAWRFCVLGFYRLGCGGNAHDGSLALHSQPRSQAGWQWGTVQAGFELTDCKPLGEVAGLSGCR